MICCCAANTIQAQLPLRDETMVEYEDYRTAVTEAPVVKQAGTPQFG